MTCPICLSQNELVFDRRERVSLLQNRLYSTLQQAREAPVGAIEMTSCRSCGFVWNAAFEPARLVYDPLYENDQANSAGFREHLAARATRILAILQRGEPSHLVEVGCGQGDFLKYLTNVGGPWIRSAAGFDPAWRGASEIGPSNIRISRTYFDRESALLLDHRPDVVLSRHTIEHVSEPVAFLTTLREACGDGRAVTLFLETPCVKWIIDNLQFQDFFYEHCSLFTADSLNLAMRRAGFRPTRIDRVFGGQYLWAEADPRSPALALSATLPLTVDEWEMARVDFIERWRKTIEQQIEVGPVYVWGVGAKGVTFALLVDPDGTRLSGAVDINPKKQGLFIPITGLKILAPDQLPLRPLTLVVMNPNYAAEIEAEVKALGRDARLLSVA
jgi:hypothetical protein